MTHSVAVRKPCAGVALRSVTFGVLLAALLAAACRPSTSAQDATRVVYVVNGTNTPYEVLLNGERTLLEARAVQQMRLADGEVTVEVVDSPFPVESAMVSIPMDSAGQPSDGALFVINPDRSAILWKGPVPQYQASGGAYRYFAGRTLYQFDGVDCAFHGPPNSSAEQPLGVRLDCVDWGPDVDVGAALLTNIEAIGEDVVCEALRWRILFEPQQRGFLMAAQQLLEPTELIELLRVGLSRRPLLMDWHRAYQEAMDAAGRHAEVEREYDQMLAAEPKNKDLMYLAARTKRNLDEARVLCERAAKGPAPSGLAQYWLTMQHLVEGQLPEAVQCAEATLKLFPNDADIRLSCVYVLIADGRRERLLELLPALEAAPVPLCTEAFTIGACTHVLMGNAEKAEETLVRLKEHLVGMAPEDAVAEQCRWPRATCSYVAGDMDAFVEALRDAKAPFERFAALLIGGDSSAAEKTLGELKDVSADVQLLLYLAAAQAGESELAERSFAAATDKLLKGRWTDRVFGRALQSGEEPIENVLESFARPCQKAIYLAALGWRYPEYREPCFDLARKLNFDRRYPHQLLERALAESEAPDER